MSSEADTLCAEIEAAAARLGIAPSTVGERAGQGGKFYTRLKNGRRVWPETAERVRARIASMLQDVDTACTPARRLQSSDDAA